MDKELGTEGTGLPHPDEGVVPQSAPGTAGNNLDSRKEVVVLHRLGRPPKYQLLQLTAVALYHHPEYIYITLMYTLSQQVITIMVFRQVKIQLFNDIIFNSARAFGM